jgi:hypothetical protein
VDFALGLTAALIGAAGVLAGTWLGGRHQVRLEREKWERSRDDAASDARAAAIGALTRHLAAALQAIVWFVWGAESRGPLFDQAIVVEYDAEMRTHFTAIIEGIVEVAHHDPVAFDALDGLAGEVFDFESKVSRHVARYLTDPEKVPPQFGALLNESYELTRGLPHRIVKVLNPAQEVRDGRPS